MKDVVIIGAGGFGREMYPRFDMVNRENGPEWNLLGMVDENATSTPEGYPILGKLEDFLKMDKSVQYFVAVANMDAREKIANRCKEAGFTAATVIMHHLVKIDPEVEIGEGSYLGGGTYKRGSKIGAHCIIQGGTVTCRGAEIGDFTSVMTSSLFGRNSKIGRKNYFGLRCNVADGVKTAENCTFGACATVTEDTTAPGVYAGVPAVLKKPLQK